MSHTLPPCFSFAGSERKFKQKQVERHETVSQTRKPNGTKTEHKTTRKSNKDKLVLRSTGKKTDTEIEQRQACAEKQRRRKGDWAHRETADTALIFLKNAKTNKITRSAQTMSTTFAYFKKRTCMYRTVR